MVRVLVGGMDKPGWCLVIMSWQLVCPHARSVSLHTRHYFTLLGASLNVVGILRPTCNLGGR